MRKYNKFNFVNKFYIFPYFFHNRILKFKRPKWVAAKNKITNLTAQITKLAQKKKKSFLLKNRTELKSNLLKVFFFNFVATISKVNSWQRLRFFYKESLLMKNAVRKYFDGQYSLAYFKRLVKKPRLRSFTLASVFIRPEFRLDILLWRLKIFTSVFLAKFAIRNQQIFVNGLIKNYDVVLGAGDVIKFSQIRTYNLRKYFLKYFKVTFIPSFIELDFYTNTIVVLKSFNHLKIKEFSSVIKEPLSLHKFKHYILK
jgi:hypothetical protein